MEMVLKLNTLTELNPLLLKKFMRVRKAEEFDVEEIYSISCSVGTSEKSSEKGFLVDDYTSNPPYYKNKIRNCINNLKHFYVAELDRVYGFLIAYTREEWLKDNPDWIEVTHWKPDFNKEVLNNFIVVDKTAIQDGLTGLGIGSIIYNKLLEDLKAENINNILAETIISPQPNFASLNFRIKQKYNLAGIRYEDYNGQLYTDLIYHKVVQ
jgi:predicted GNAT family acetyltransferase